ncbi:phage tail family protein [Mangrovibacillus cuniculi]|uniref:Phage tail family protein n=1 Tax=Mangrovibacillus cuniculi TaxID=2593652 RepID=A0A7S8HG10_9BACI|nr:phage tail family protein [Mangrovibacillus cuniculi]QPC47106.1 phage tail family protein [Mangrovibacillus cuniculi]
MQQITFHNNLGKSIVLSNHAPFMLNKVEGLGDVGVSINSSKSPYQDGTTYIDNTLEPRMITMEVTILGETPTDMQRNRALLSSILNPKLGPGVLRYENDLTVSEIRCVLESVPKFPSGMDSRGMNFQRSLLTFYCNSPFWKSLVVEEEPTFEALFQFPFEDEFEMGMQRDRRVIHNDGDAPCPIQVEFHGPAVNPIITNTTTGEFIRVNQTLGEDEYMLIDTSDEEKSVVFIDGQNNQRNVFNWIDLRSDFFKLQLGENIIEYSADSDIQGAIVNIRYQKQFNSV